MAHFPYYALSNSLEMMHGLKLTKQKKKAAQEASLSYRYCLHVKLNHPVALVALNGHLLWAIEPLTVAAALLQ